MIRDIVIHTGWSVEYLLEQSISFLYDFHFSLREYYNVAEESTSTVKQPHNRRYNDDEWEEYDGRGRKSMHRTISFNTFKKAKDPEKLLKGALHG